MMTTTQTGTDDLSLDMLTVARGLATLPATSHPLVCGHVVCTRRTTLRTAYCRDCRREVASAEHDDLDVDLGGDDEACPACEGDGCSSCGWRGLVASEVCS